MRKLLELAFITVCALLAWSFAVCLVVVQTTAFILPVVALYLWL